MDYCTCNPHADAERLEDDQEAAAEREEAHCNALADEFVSAVQWGGDEPLANGTVSSVLDELSAEHPELFRELMYTAALSKDPAVRCAVQKVADAYVEHFRSVLADPQLETSTKGEM